MTFTEKFLLVMWGLLLLWLTVLMGYVVYAGIALPWEDTVSGTLRRDCLKAPILGIALIIFFLAAFALFVAGFSHAIWGVGPEQK